jgi:hypothetical protein
MSGQSHGLFYFWQKFRRVFMAISDDDLDSIAATATKTATRGARGVQTGDKNVQFIDPGKLLDVKHRLSEEDNGGMYDVAFTPKNYF